MSQWAEGWYPDPENDEMIRWWDGTAWTEHRQPAQGVGATGASAAPGTPSGGSGSKALLLVAAVTLVVLALLCAIGVFAFRAMGGGGSPSSSSTTSASTSPTSPSSPPSSSPTPSSSSPAPSGPTTNVTSVIKAKVGTTYRGNGNGAIIEEDEPNRGGFFCSYGLAVQHLAGGAHPQVAQVADEVILAVCGLPVKVK